MSRGNPIHWSTSRQAGWSWLHSQCLHLNLLTSVINKIVAYCIPMFCVLFNDNWSLCTVVHVPCAWACNSDSELYLPTFPLPAGTQLLYCFGFPPNRKIHVSFYFRVPWVCDTNKMQLCGVLLLRVISASSAPSLPLQHSFSITCPLGMLRLHWARGSFSWIYFAFLQTFLI